MTQIANGVWPTMLTPFLASGDVDYEAIPPIVDWYIENGCSGIFSVCQSSEMFDLTLEERVRCAELTVQAARGRVAVIASGHVSDDKRAQLVELRAIAKTGVAAVVLVTNRLARADESDDVWIDNAQSLLGAIPDIPFGLYECPMPYKRILSDRLLHWCAQTQRFAFLKDTCCHIDTIKRRLHLLEGSGLKLFNANTDTLLQSLREGASGFSGVMANFHPDLYVALTQRYRECSHVIQQLSAFLCLSSTLEDFGYPANAKYHMALSALPIGTCCRGDFGFDSDGKRSKIEQLCILEEQMRQMLRTGTHIEAGG